MSTGTRFRRALSRTWKRLRRRPFPGEFVRQILDQLRHETFPSRAGNSPLHVDVKSVERGNNPFHENFNIRFQLVAAPSSWTFDEIDILTEPVGVIEHISSVGHPGGEPIVLPSDYFFQFSSAQSVAKNLEQFRAFVGPRSSLQTVSSEERPTIVKFDVGTHYSAVANANLPATDDIQ